MSGASALDLSVDPQPEVKNEGMVNRLLRENALLTKHCDSWSRDYKSLAAKLDAADRRVAELEAASSPSPVERLRPLIEQKIVSWRKEAKGDRMAAAITAMERSTRHHANALEDLAVRSEKHATELEALLSAPLQAIRHENLSGAQRKNLLIKQKIMEWCENSRRAGDNAQNVNISSLDQRQCLGVSLAYDQCAGELEALLSAPSPDAPEEP
jgi:hypothetical protein